MKKMALILVLFPFASLASAQWYPQQSGTSTFLWDVFLSDENHGWVTGINEAGFGDSLLMRTTDGGLTWDSIATVGYNNYQFIDSLNGYAKGGNYENLYQTNDGGYTWEICFEGNVKDFEFFNLYDGLLMSGERGVIYETNGASWSMIDTIVDGNPWVVEMDFINPNEGFLLTAYQPPGGDWIDHSILKTIDGGHSWTQTTATFPAIPGIASNLNFTNSDVGYLNHFGYLDTYGLYKTNDGSNSPWEIIHPHVIDYYFIDTINGWITCGEGILSTIDGGNSWETQCSEEVLPYAIFFIDSIHGLAVGENGTILHTENGGGIVSVKEYIDNEILIEIYPNPVSSSSTNIKFNLPERSEVSIALLNASGQAVRMIDPGSLGSGAHQFRIDMKDLCPGLYHLQFIHNKELIIRKLIKM